MLNIDSIEANGAAAPVNDVLHSDVRMIDWAERVNQQFQTQAQALAPKAGRWMRQVQQRDPVRLYRGVRKAFRLMMEAGRGADLKKAFYSGLLGQANEAEMREFDLQLPR